jgi:integrin alpha FG-GAP repeat containing protein 1
MLRTITRTVALAPLFAAAVQAFTVWPFKEKRFKFEGLIDAGSLGLEDLTGSIVGFGDWNGDQSWV